jgi:hypothetical protein
MVVFAQHKVRSDIARRPRVEQGRRVGTEFIEQVGERLRSIASKGALTTSPEYSEGRDGGLRSPTQ